MSPELISLTGRLKLKPPSPADDAAVVRVRTHPTTRKYLQFLPEHLTIDAVRQRREARVHDATIIDFHIYLVTEGETENFAGTTGCFLLNEEFRSCEAGILIVPELFGKAIATEALHTLLKWLFEEKKFNRVTFETASDNYPMCRWLEVTAGARLEAQRRECWRNVDGSYSDVRGYSILEREWSQCVKIALEDKLGTKYKAGIDNALFRDAQIPFKGSTGLIHGLNSR